MFSFSHTAPRITQEQEEKEYADLRPEERDKILDDVYGRNAEEIAEINTREISSQELDAFHEALGQIPLNDKVDVVSATIRCPELLYSESDPVLFLRCEGYDPERAARRFARYWAMRVEVFGTEKAFLPMTLTGAYADDDEVLQMMKDFPFFRTFLPDDSSGRTVVFGQTSHDNDEYNNISRDVKLRFVWYNAQMASRFESAIRKGVVCMLQQSRSFKLGLFDRIKEKKFTKVYLEIMPFTVRAVHYCYAPGSTQEIILPAMKFFMNREVRQRFICHQIEHNPKSSHQNLSELEPYGFTVEGLPPSLGGTFELNHYWAEEQLIHEEQNDE